MKYMLIGIIRLYQQTPISTHHLCRFIPTCSNYTIEAINTHGTIKGVILGTKRILSCRPGGKSGIDLVPERKNKK